MTSDIQLLFALKVSLNREVDSGNWPDATQGENAIVHSLEGVDLEVWNDAYIAKIPVAGGADVTVDLRDFADLLFEENKAFDVVFGLAAQMALDDPLATDAALEIRPGDVDPLQWFFTAVDEGITLLDGETAVHLCRIDSTGYVVDASNSTLKLSNTGADDCTLTLIIIGGT